MFFERLSRASANVAETRLEHHFGMLVVLIDAVGGNDHAIGFAASQPLCFFLYGGVGFQHGWLDFGVRIVKPEDEFSVVHVAVGAVDDQPRAWPNDSGPFGLGAKRSTTFPF